MLRAKGRALVNHGRAVLAESPVKVLATIGFVLLIWAGLYGLFREVFYLFEANHLVGAVAIPLVFGFFFVALLVLLTFSNAILAYSSLFSRDEAAYLLTAPLSPRTVVAVKYLEVLFFSSWSLILLGLPLMLAVARSTGEPRVFCPLFVAFFLSFVPIPGAAGLITAWFTARFLPRNLRKSAVAVLSVGALIAVVWGLRAIHLIEDEGGNWLDTFLFRMDFVQSALLPSSWITKGIDHAMHARLHPAFMYLLLTVANTLFLSWLAVVFTADRLFPALDRASTGRGGAARLPAKASGGALGAVFFYLPRSVKLIAVKDLRTYLRDPLQWSQLAILFGLMGLYLLNMPRFQVEFFSERWALLVPMLNFGAVGFILATFTSRFVFPLVSLEGHQFWLIGLLPMERRDLLWAKFAFAMTVSVVVSVGAMALATIVLKIVFVWAVVHLAITFATCVGLCGLSVGIGARMPMFKQRNTARIASGFGGTVNLIASVALVIVVLAGFGALSWRAYEKQLQTSPDVFTWLGVVGVIVLACSAGMSAMRMGVTHLNRLEA